MPEEGKEKFSAIVSRCFNLFNAISSESPTAEAFAGIAPTPCFNPRNQARSEGEASLIRFPTDKASADLKGEVGHEAWPLNTSRCLKSSFVCSRNVQMLLGWFHMLLADRRSTSFV